MNRLRKLTIFAATSLLLCLNSFFCTAEDLIWLEDKNEVFRLAKEQDKQIFLLVGRPTCGNCQRTFGYFNDPEGPLRQIIEDGYILWYSLRDNAARKAEVKVYTEEFDGIAKSLPFLYVINPEDSLHSVASQWGGKTVEVLEDMINIDLMANNTLNWYSDEEENEMINLAKEEEKYIFKFVGRGTSNNSQKVMTQLNEEPLKQLLEENFILWNSQQAEMVLNTDDAPKTSPYISILNPQEPEKSVESTEGFISVETLELLLKAYPVANHPLVEFPEPQVVLSENTLHITNHIENELLSIYTITGKKIYSVHKNECEITIDTSGFPKGILIIHSSKGWSSKIINR